MTTYTRNVTIASASFSVPSRIVSASWMTFCRFYNVNVPVICLQCVTRSSSSFRGRLTKTLKGCSSFHISFIINFKLSNSCQQKYSVIIRKTVLRNTDWVNLWMNLWMVCHKTMLLRIRMLFWVGVRKSLIFPSGYMAYTCVSRWLHHWSTFLLCMGSATGCGLWNLSCCRPHLRHRCVSYRLIHTHTHYVIHKLLAIYHSQNNLKTINAEPGCHWLRQTQSPCRAHSVITVYLTIEPCHALNLPQSHCVWLDVCVHVNICEIRAVCRPTGHMHWQRNVLSPSANQGLSRNLRGIGKKTYLR